MKAIYITDWPDNAEARDLLESHVSSLVTVTPTQDIISLVYMDPPDLILVDERILAGAGRKTLEEFMGTTIVGHVPVAAVLEGYDREGDEWMDLPIDDYIVLTDQEKAMQWRLAFMAKRSTREMDLNPLTRLPGNESIIRRIQEVIDAREEAAIAWVDIDNFKPFNDRYGFSRGDEVILATARIITNAAREITPEKVFVGHVGGDDFVFVCPAGMVGRFCEDVIDRFDTVIKNFYNDEDVETGGIVSKGRDGVERKYGAMTVSIAVVLNVNGRYSHYGQAAQDASDIKKYLKGLKGSNYMIDRRAGRS